MDLLKKLLSTDLNVTKQVFIKRLDSVLTVKGITNEEFEEIHERATYYEGKGNKRTKKYDNQQATHMSIAKCLVEPNLNDPEVLKSTGVDEPWQAVAKLFLPGEQDLLETAIGECSGFVDGEVEIEEVKN
ncbi:phage tail assembly chaperone [Psychrobacillus sp. FSL K6-1267]|uniref:phage tail assembly chaperone n=1 Tax=Psychrobacillus sp. FSL K6-1267 TaxID=2921543 RepID=UPI0030FC5BAC